MGFNARKRAIDCLVALAALIVFSPVMLVICLLVKLTSPGPVFYIGIRLGRYGKVLRLRKFRTMYDGAPPGEPAENDSRITPFGAFLRRFKLDELPQLWLVVIGDCAIVGPRPMDINRAVEFGYNAPCITPGLVPVVSAREEQVGLRVRIQAELEYASKQSHLHDLHLIWVAVICIIWPEKLAQHALQLSETFGSD